MSDKVKPVDTDVSDLFMRLDLQDTQELDRDGMFVGWNDTRLRHEADGFASTIRLISGGVLDYTADDIVADFLTRV